MIDRGPKDLEVGCGFQSPDQALRSLVCIRNHIDIQIANDVDQHLFQLWQAHLVEGVGEQVGCHRLQVHGSERAGMETEDRRVHGLETLEDELLDGVFSYTAREKAGKGAPGDSFAGRFRLHDTVPEFGRVNDLVPVAADAAHTKTVHSR